MNVSHSLHLSNIDTLMQGSSDWKPLQKITGQSSKSIKIKTVPYFLSSETSKVSYEVLIHLDKSKGEKEGWKKLCLTVAIVHSDAKEKEFKARAEAAVLHFYSEFKCHAVNPYAAPIKYHYYVDKQPKNRLFAKRISRHAQEQYQQLILRKIRDENKSKAKPLSDEQMQVVHKKLNNEWSKFFGIQLEATFKQWKKNFLKASIAADLAGQLQKMQESISKQFNAVKASPQYMIKVEALKRKLRYLQNYFVTNKYAKYRLKDLSAEDKKKLGHIYFLYYDLSGNSESEKEGLKWCLDAALEGSTSAQATLKIRLEQELLLFSKNQLDIHSLEKNKLRCVNSIMQNAWYVPKQNGIEA